MIAYCGLDKLHGFLLPVLRVGVPLCDLGLLFLFTPPFVFDVLDAKVRM